MSHVRSLLRLPLMAIVTGLLFVLWLLTRPLALFSAALGRRTHFALVRTWARGLAWILNVEIKVSGNQLKPPVFLVSNHLSYLDIIVLLSVVDGFFVAKSEVASWPILGFLARSTGTLFIDRSRKSDLRRVTPLIEEILDSGSNVFVFPEGTSTQGEEVLPFKPSMFEAAIRGKVPVSAASLTYSTPSDGPPAHLAVCWWGDMTFLKHCYELVGLKAIQATVTFTGQPLIAEDRKSLALDAHEAVNSIFTPVARLECTT